MGGEGRCVEGRGGKGGREGGRRWDETSWEVREGEGKGREGR